MKNQFLKRILIVAVVIFFTIFVDQVSKSLISKNMELYSLKSIIPGVLNFRYITNYGFLLGIGSNLNDGRTFNGVVIITIIALIILLGYFIYILFQKTTTNFLLITFSILIGGAWGNFIDRLIKGKVVDFLEIVLPFHRIGRFYIGSTPIFNMADFFVSIGIVLLLIYYFIIEPKEHKKIKEMETSSIQDYSDSIQDYKALNQDYAEYKEKESNNNYENNIIDNFEDKTDVDIHEDKS